ncbi:MAG: sugar phosphate isomerase/epimerase [Verrucomicrobiaceae bacterium]|nr:sugar phosphate isomerase/epimerase [Verrucomicrobiaceae bacterium]
MNTRRHFFTTLSGAAAAATLRAQDSALSYKGENIQYGLVTYMWGAKWDLPTLIQNLNEADVRGVELRVDHAHGVNPDINAEQRSKVRAQFADAGIELVGMGCNWEFHSPDAAEVKKNIEGAKQYIKLSHDVGGSGVKVKPNQLPKDVPVEKTLEQIAKSLAELADYSLGFGQQIRLEVHGGVSDLGHIAQIMKMADRDNVRVCWNSNKQDLEGGIESNFAKVQDYLGATTHVRETSAPDYPWDKLASLLVNADYAGWILLEGHKPPTANAVAALQAEKAKWVEWITAARKAAK